MTQAKIKTCAGCGEEKSLEAFSKNSRAKDGKQSRCKVCNKAYHEENKEKIKERQREYYLDNKDKLAKHSLDYYQSNREHRLDYQRVYNQSNKDKIREYKREWKRKRYASDPVFALSVNCRRRIQKALKGFSKESTTAEILGCTWEHLMHHLESQFTAGMSWDNQGEWHVDHIIPLASENTAEGKVALCHYTNLQPLWAHENLAKGARLDWASEGVAP